MPLTGITDNATKDGEIDLQSRADEVRALTERVLPELLGVRAEPYLM